MINISHLLRGVPIVAGVVHRLDVQEHEVVLAADQLVRHRCGLRVELGPVVPGRAGNLGRWMHSLSLRNGGSGENTGRLTFHMYTIPVAVVPIRSFCSLRIFGASDTSHPGGYLRWSGSPSSPYCHRDKVWAVLFTEHMRRTVAALVMGTARQLIAYSTGAGEPNPARVTHSPRMPVAAPRAACIRARCQLLHRQVLPSA